MRYWLSTPKMTVSVETDGQHIIRGAAPIVHKFIGQPLDNLLDWLRKQGQLEMMEI